MAKREEQANVGGIFTLLNQLAGDAVDRGNVIGIDGVSQSKTIGQKRRAELHRPIVEQPRSDDPCADVERAKQNNQEISS